VWRVDIGFDARTRPLAIARIPSLGIWDSGGLDSSNAGYRLKLTVVGPG
jgi:hypothetical protein